MSNGTFQVLKPERRRTYCAAASISLVPSGHSHTATPTPTQTHTEQASEVLRDYTHPIITYTVRPHECPTTTESETHELAPQRRAQRETVFSFHTIQWVFTRLNYNFS